uniref:Ribonuclease H-like domain containing protein n=1 Tax=Tanacetum cinerariifolium TaxID=118510 RepID=A0A6L2LHN9_TANCI|nr:ribonuclease H-like domain containing protein [Tanacetum cinerariifolium]
MSKRATPRQANMVNDNMNMIAMVSDVIAMISEVNLVGNSATTDIKGEGDVILKMTFEKELKLTNVLLSRYHVVIKGYNENWIYDIKDSRLTSRYMFAIGGAAISWKFSKQTVIAKSIMKSEFIALDKCGEEAEWLHQFVDDIPRWPKPVTAISIHCDSQSAIGRALNIMYNGKSGHICHRHNSIRQLLSTGVISINYVKSKDNITDPLTKGLSRELFSKSSKGMGLKPSNEFL